MPIAPIIPYEPGNIPEVIQSELNRRKFNRGFNFIDGNVGDWSSVDGDWNLYKGPMTPWVRFCSNGAGKQSNLGYEKQGFVLFGGKDFYSGYGFSKQSDEVSSAILGYTPEGKIHSLEYDINNSNFPIYVPPPEIENVNVIIQKELFRRASIEWVCFSSKQLEYLTPYFLIPGISCVLEWGWNHFDPSSLLDLTNLTELKKLKLNPYPLYNQRILRSRGNYDVLFGIVTHFEWSIDGNKIKAKTEITSPDRIYAGISVETNIVAEKSENTLAPEITSYGILDSLKNFILTSLPNIKTVSSSPDPLNIKLNLNNQSFDGYSVDDLDPISQFARYLVETYPEEKFGERWKEILYSVFYGRDLRDNRTYISPLYGRFANIKSKSSSVDFNLHDSLKYDNKDKDFDRREPNKHVWISMDMLVEILNFHSKNLNGYDGNQMFRIDINDCVISGHPNLISSNGYKILIPNAEAPKYFYGIWGKGLTLNPNDDREYGILGNSDISPKKLSGGKSELEKAGLLPDWRLYKICGQFNYSAYRDNLDIVINSLRYSGKLANKSTYEFPNLSDKEVIIDGVSYTYPARYSGYLKNIYFNISELQNILKDPSTKTFTDVINKVLETISVECGNFWDLRLVDTTGDAKNVKKDDIATMKIVDYRFIYSINKGNVYSFDYYDSDSLIQSIKFSPTISNAQAIRTIYSTTNNTSNPVTLSDTDELLNYSFKDRLFLSEVQKNKKPNIKISSTFIQTIQSLQSINPPEGSFQMTFKNTDEQVVVKRLAIPPENPEILKLLLDDGDLENNPKYIGIMPGIQAQFTIQGIGGLRTFMMFLVRNLPEPYSHKNIVFRIVDLNESIQNGQWTTVITAGVIPLRKHIKRRLGITD